MWQPVFVPPAAQLAKPVQELPLAASGFSAACAAAIFDIAPVRADDIDEAAHVLAEKAYPFLKEIPWSSEVFAKHPYASNLDVLKGLEKVFLIGAEIDRNELKKGALAHSKAIASMDAKGVCSLADFDAICAALGHMLASVPEKTIMDGYSAFVTNANWEKDEVPQYLMGLVNAADAQEAYQALMAFKDVVKAAR